MVFCYYFEQSGIKKPFQVCLWNCPFATLYHIFLPISEVHPHWRWRWLFTSLELMICGNALWCFIWWNVVCLTSFRKTPIIIILLVTINPTMVHILRTDMALVRQKHFCFNKALANTLHPGECKETFFMQILKIIVIHFYVLIHIFAVIVYGLLKVPFLWTLKAICMKTWVTEECTRTHWLPLFLPTVHFSLITDWSSKQRTGGHQPTLRSLKKNKQKKPLFRTVT